MCFVVCVYSLCGVCGGGDMSLVVLALRLFCSFFTFVASWNSELFNWGVTTARKGPLNSTSFWAVQPLLPALLVGDAALGGPTSPFFSDVVLCSPLGWCRFLVPHFGWWCSPILFLLVVAVFSSSSSFCEVLPSSAS